MTEIRLDQTYLPRWWRCRCGRVLGVVMRDACRIRRLWVFHQDRNDANMPTVQEIIQLPRGMFRNHGVDVCRGVECSQCGALTEWMSNDLHSRLIVQYQRRMTHAAQANAAV